MQHSDSKKHVSECQKTAFSVDLNMHDGEPVPSEKNRGNKICSISCREKHFIWNGRVNLKFLSRFRRRSGNFEKYDDESEYGTESTIIKNVLCVREQERLVAKLHNNKFSIFVDETDLTNDKWIMFLVHYVNPQPKSKAIMSSIIFTKCHYSSNWQSQTQTQKIVQKMQEPTMSTVQSAQTKQSPIGRRYHQFKFADRQDDSLNQNKCHYIERKCHVNMIDTIIVTLH